MVGFDNLTESAFFEPPLTTVHQDFRALGQRGIALLLAQLRGDTAHQAALGVLKPVLVMRSSVGEPP